MGLIVPYRAPVLDSGRAGREEKSPIHVADVIRMRESNLRLDYKSGHSAQEAVVSGIKSGLSAGAHTVGDRTVERRAGNIQAATSDSVESLEPDRAKRVKFVLRDSRGRELSEGEEVDESPNRNLPRETDELQNCSLPSRIVTRTYAPSARTGTDRSISENLLPSPKQIQEDTADVRRQTNLLPAKGT